MQLSSTFTENISFSKVQCRIQAHRIALAFAQVLRLCAEEVHNTCQEKKVLQLRMRVCKNVDRANAVQNS
jgi:hypothetical protein